jgi:hypothetical protein
VERAKYEAELAQRRFLKVDPDNRLVADVLEADWNAKLRAVAAAQEAYQKAAMADVNVVNDTERAELMALASDFPRLWRDPRTQMKDKSKRQFGAVLARHCGRMVAVGHGSNFYVYAYAQS